MFADPTRLKIFQTNRSISPNVNFPWARVFRVHSELLKVGFGVLDAFHPKAQVMKTFFHPAIGIIVARHNGQIGHPIGQIKIFRI
jgi:hypothetical protein